jgi:hypothetical protein
MLPAPPAPAVPVASPSNVTGLGFSDGLVVRWQPQRNTSNHQIVDHYKVYVGTTSSIGPGAGKNNLLTRVVSAETLSACFLWPLATGTYYVAVAGSDQGMDGPMSTPVQVTVTSGAGGSTVSGLFEYGPWVPTGPVFGSLSSAGGGIFGEAFVPTSDPFAFQIANVPDDAYQAIEFVDMLGDCEIGPTDPHVSNQAPIYPISTPTATQIAFVTPSTGQVLRDDSIRTAHYLVGGNEGYYVDLSIDSSTRIARTVSLVSTSNGTAVPLDLGVIPETGSGTVSWSARYQTGTTPPAAGTQLQFLATYPDDTTEDLVGTVSALLDLPMITGPSSSVTSDPTLTWTLPSTLPPTYHVQVMLQPFGGTETVTSLPQGTLSFPTSGLLHNVAYSWTIKLSDDYGNNSYEMSSFLISP